MGPDSNVVLDRLLQRASESALTSLDALIDVEQRLRDLKREIKHDAIRECRDTEDQ